MTSAGRRLSMDLDDVMRDVEASQRRVMDGLNASRQRLAAMKAERQALLALPVDAGFALERVSAWVDERVGSLVSSMSHSPTQGEWSKPPRPEDFTAAPNDFRTKESDILATLVFYLKPELSAAIGKTVSALYTADMRTISERDRAAQLSALDQRILDAEIAEEKMIRSAARAGLSIDRRADANPRAVNTPS